MSFDPEAFEDHCDLVGGEYVERMVRGDKKYVGCSLPDGRNVNVLFTGGNPEYAEGWTDDSHHVIQEPETVSAKPRPSDDGEIAALRLEGDTGVLDVNGKTRIGKPEIHFDKGKTEEKASAFARHRLEQDRTEGIKERRD